MHKTYIKSNPAVTTRLRQLINKNPWEQEHKKGQRQGSQKQDSQKKDSPKQGSQKRPWSHMTFIVFALRKKETKKLKKNGQ